VAVAVEHLVVARSVNSGAPIICGTQTTPGDWADRRPAHKIRRSGRRLGLRPDCLNGVQK
jgi:hypothetical protein